MMRRKLLIALGVGALAAKEATSTIPIVMVGASDPIAARLVGNLARPGGNVTGTSTQTTAAVGKLLELIPQFLPGATRGWPRCGIPSTPFRNN